MTGWKRRSSAASFSMFLRYSSSVVAPMQCSSPRASIGFSKLPASIAPSAAPAPTTVCNSSMKRMISPEDSTTSLSTAFNRSSNSPRNFAPSMRAPLDDRRLTDAGLADQHGVVLRSSGKNLDDATDLLVAADHRVDFALR